MPIHVSLCKSLSTGTLGPIHIGMSKPELRAVVGEPDDTLLPPRRKSKSLGWVLGDIEIHFSPADETVHRIFVDDFDLISGGSKLDTDPGPFRGKMDLDSLMHELRALPGSFREVQSPDPMVRWFRTGMGVTLAPVVKAEHYSPPLGLHAIWWDGSPSAIEQ